MASATDLVRYATPNFATTLANSMLSSDTSMTLSSVVGLSTATGITLVIDATDPVSGLPTPTLKEVATGVVSGSTVSNLVRGQDGTTQQAHASGANVVMYVTANLWNDFETSYLTQHNQLGTHKGITTDTLAASGNATVGGTLGVTGATSLSGGATVNGNPVWQYLGSASITSNFTTTSSTAVQVTGLTVTVTVPSGYTKVKITIFTEAIYASTGTGYVNSGIWRGTVGSGTQIQRTATYASGSTQAETVCAFALDTPGAGSVTYNAALWTNVGTATWEAGTTYPGYILVECC